jgi:hypothetical protein
VLAAVVVVAVAGCGSGGQSEVSRGQYTIYVHHGSLLPRGGADALLEGTLVTTGDCVHLETEAGAAHPVVWPSGTSIADDDPLTLRLGSGEKVTVGERVTGGGGVYDVGNRSVVRVDIAEECRAETGEVHVFNPDAELGT